jgi:hypothetical protein
MKIRSALRRFHRKRGVQIIHDYSARCRYVLAMALSSVGTILDNRFYDGDRFVHLTD